MPHSRPVDLGLVDLGLIASLMIDARDEPLDSASYWRAASAVARDQRLTSPSVAY